MEHTRRRTAGDLDLASLNGSNGFVVKGNEDDQFGGYASSGSGDINGDGLDDIIIGGPCHQSFDDDEIHGATIVSGSDSGSSELRRANVFGQWTGHNVIRYDVAGVVKRTSDSQLVVSATAQPSPLRSETDDTNNVATVHLDLLPLPGDINLDGAVELSDFLIHSENFGRQDAAYSHGDLDGDGHVHFADFLILSANFGRTTLPALPTINPREVDAVFDDTSREQGRAEADQTSELKSESPMGSRLV